MDWINRLSNIQNKIKLQLHSKRIDDLESLYRLMAQFDKDNSGRLDKHEFEKLLSQLGVFLTTQELRAVYDTYDVNRDEQIAYAEFVQLIRTSISEKRLAVVKHAFQFLDRRGANRLSIKELVQQFRAEAHPRVRTRHKTAEQVKQEFANAISKKSQDGSTITEGEFLEYYADVNATLPKEKEEYFVDIILSTWGITSSVDYVSPERLADLEVILYEKIRQKTFTKEDEGKTVYRAFKYFDVQENGVIDIIQFRATLDKFGCVFTDKEIQALFNKFDSNRSGKICYDEFCGIFAAMGSGNNPNVNPVFQLTRQVPSPIIAKLASDLKKKGIYAFRNLSRACLKADTFQNGTLSHQEFQWVVKEVGFQLTKTEFDNLFKYFDKNFEGKVVYQVFIDLVRGDQSDAITEAIVKAFNSVGGPEITSLTLEAVLSKYNAAALNIISPTRKGISDLAREFAAQWNTKLVNKKSFLDFFTDIRAASENESAFNQYISAAFP